MRPTTDFAKSGLFNILNNYFNFEDLVVLDLFCGIGSISFEFASRGSKHVTSVDDHAGCLKFIKELSDRLKISSISAIKADAFKFLKQNDRKYDIIFADPPFDSAETDTLPDLILDKKMLNENGWLIVEHQSKRILKSKAIPFQVRKYGNCTFSIYTPINS